MGFNKSKGISTTAAIVALVTFNLAAFLLPLPHSITFWIGYSFTFLAVLLFLICSLFLFDAESKDAKFLRLPVISVAWGYFLLQTAAGFWEILDPGVGYYKALIINCCITGFFIITSLASQAAGNHIKAQEAHISQKVLFLKSIQSVLSSIKTKDMELSQKLAALNEAVKFSDPMSHSSLSEVENQIEARTVMLKSEIGDKEKAIAEIENINDLMNERNQKCRLYKNVPEARKEKDNSGARCVSLTFGVLAVFAVVALVVCFVVIPNNRYKEAEILYENKQYNDAISIFSDLNGFRNSDEMISICVTSEKEDRYNDACILFESKDYEGAISILETLDTYKDSKELIATIERTACEEKYTLAQSCFDNQDYLKAIVLYKELGEYEDSAQKLEQLYNRLADDDVLYYGSYENEPIAWKVILTSTDSLLLITENTICELPYNNEIKSVSWNDSSICSWLNTDFLNSFSEEQLSDILFTETEGVKSQVFLLSRSEVRTLGNRFNIQCNEDWWLRTNSGVNASYVTSNGEVSQVGDAVVQAKGIRPCIWIDLT